MSAAITWNWTDGGEKWQSYCLQSGRWYDAEFTKEFTDKIEAEFLSVFSESIGLGFEAVHVRMEAVWTKIEDEIHALLGDVEESADRCREQMRDEFDCNLHSLMQETEDPQDWMERNIGPNAGLNALWCVSAWFLCGEGDSGVYVLDLEESGLRGWGIVSRICDDEADIDETEDLFVGTFQQVQHIVESILRGKKEILQDIASGTVPANVDCFGDLDDHADSAMYGGRGDDGWFAALGQSCVDAMGSDADPSDACDPDQCKAGIHDSVYGWGIQADAANALETALSVWLQGRALADA